MIPGLAGSTSPTPLPGTPARRVFLALLALCALSAPAGAEIEPGALETHVRALSDAALQGRATGSEGAAEAARYIADRFRAFGLEPAGTGEDANDFFHAFQVYTGVRVQGVIGLKDDRRGYAFNDEYTPLGLSADGHHLGDLVFVGYGVSAPERGYDDYAGLDVRDKIVLAFLGEPGMKDPESPFDGTSPTAHSDLYRKAEVARERGAKGLLLTPGPLYAQDLDQVWKISTEAGYRDAGIMICQLAYRAAAALVSPSEMDLAELQRQIDERHVPRSTAVANRVEMRVQMRRVATDMVNVIAKVPGESEQAVVLSANYDGYGLGPDNANPILHPSANDNASGVAALLEVARELASGSKPARTIYLVATCGRRLTSAGSEALVRDRVLDPEEVALHLNVFALGTRNGARLEVFGTGTGTSGGAELGALLGTANQRTRVPVTLVTSPGVASVGDHIPWHREGVPVLTLFGGAHREIGTPEDTPELVDWSALAQRARFLRELATAAAEAEPDGAYRP